MSRWSRVWRPVAVAVVATGAGLTPGGSVSARTMFDFSVPTDGATIGEVLTEVTVGFTDPVTLVGPGFEVSDPLGDVSQPFVVTDDDTVFRLQIDPPISHGAVSVRYEVEAENGHLISGGFSFAVNAPVPSTVPTASAPSTVPATAPSTVPATAGPAVSRVTTTSAPRGAATATVASTAVPPVESGVSRSVEPPESNDGDGGGTAVYVLVAAVVAVLAGGFLLIRRST